MIIFGDYKSINDYDNYKRVIIIFDDYKSIKRSK